MPGDEMQHREETVLEVRDVEHVCHFARQKQLIRGFNHNSSNAFTVDHSIICNTNGDVMRLVISEPLLMRGHVQCSASVSNPGEVRRQF
jgi:hypothetical protein